MGAEISTNAPITHFDKADSLGDALPARGTQQPKAPQAKKGRVTQRSDQDYLDILLNGKQPKTKDKVASREVKGVLLSPKELEAREERVAQVSREQANREAKPKQDEHNEMVAKVRVFEKWHRENPHASDAACRKAGVPNREQLERLRGVLANNEANLLNDVSRPNKGLVAVRLDSKEFQEALANVPKRKTALENHNEFAEKVAVFTRWEKENPSATDAQRRRAGVPSKATVEKWRELVTTSERNLIKSS